jgi:hypothetical protein
VAINYARKDFVNVHKQNKKASQCGMLFCFGQIELKLQLNAIVFAVNIGHPV